MMMAVPNSELNVNGFFSIQSCHRSYSSNRRLMMANGFFILFLLVAMVALLVPCSTQPLIMQQQPVPEIDHMLKSIRGMDEFRSWAPLLSMIMDTELQITGATIFVSSDEALSRQFPCRRRRRVSLNIDFLVPHVLYHIVPRRLNISDLGSLMIGTQIPTLLSGKSITVTNATEVNHCRITHPNLYINSSIVVHGMDAFFDYRVHCCDEPLVLEEE